MSTEDKDLVQVTNNEMVLDDILGEDIIGETSDHEPDIKAEKIDEACTSTRSRNDSYGSDISSTGSVSKGTTMVNWDDLDARYFIIKSNNMDNVEISMEKGVWATPRRNEDVLVEAYRHTKHVILIFSVRESGHFQGIARMMSMPRPNRGEVNWIVGHTPILRMLPNIFKIQWLDKTPLDFTQTSHIKNRWNEWKQVKISRDGQEVEPESACELCHMWPDCNDPDSLIPPQPSRRKSDSDAAARSSRSEEPVSPSAVKTTYSSYKDDSYKKISPEPMSDSEEPPPPGLSSRMKDRLGAREAEEERRKKRREESRTSKPHHFHRPKPNYRSNNYHRDSRGGHRTTDTRRDRHRDRETRHRPTQRHRSRSPARRKSPEKSTAKDILLHGSYLDYVREYQSKHSRLAALLQDPVLRQDIFNAASVAATSSSRSSSRRSRKDDKHLDSRAHSALVDEFLSTHTRR